MLKTISVARYAENDIKTKRIELALQISVLSRLVPLLYHVTSSFFPSESCEKFSFIYSRLLVGLNIYLVHLHTGEKHQHFVCKSKIKLP